MLAWGPGCARRGGRRSDACVAQVAGDLAPDSGFAKSWWDATLVEVLPATRTRPPSCRVRYLEARAGAASNGGGERGRS